MGLGKTYSTQYLLDSNNSSGVAGQVLSTTSTGIDWADANTLPGSGLWLENGNDIYNSNSGNVGIGVTSPNAKLHIAGGSSGMFLSNLGDNSAYDSIKMSYGGYNSGTPEFIFTQTSTPGSGIANTWYRFKNTNGVEGTNPNNVANVTIGGKLGIGTDSPGTTLDVNGAARIMGAAAPSSGAGLELYYSGGTSNILSFDRAGLYKDINISALSTKIFANGSQAVTVLSGGNVGIGTTSPDTKLEVRTDSGAAVANSYFRVTAGAQGAYGGTAHFEGAYNDYGNVDQPNIVGKIDMASEIVTPTDVGGTMKFFTKATGGTYATAPIERMRITSSGNIGIGGDTSAWSLGKTIQINGDYGAINYNGVRAILGIVNAYYNGSGYIRQNVGYAASIDFNTAVSGGGLAFRTENSTGAAGDTISLTTKVAILSNGRVGIGTTTVGTLHGVSYGPTMLHVDGGSSRGQMILEGDQLAGVIMSDNGATANERVFSTMVDGGNYQIKPINDNGTSTAAGAAITVLHNSNVGIGTTDPLGNSKLHVSSANGTAYTSNAQLRVSSAITNNNRAAIMFSDDATSDGKISYYPHTTAASRFFSISARLTESDFIIKGNGNVGIGTTSPSEKLTVDAQSADGVTTTIASFHSNEGESGDTAIQLAVRRSDSLGSDRKTFLNATGAGNFEIQRSGSTKVTISGDGDVGIGTTSPDKDLTVGGINPTHGINLRTKSGSSEWLIWSVEQYFSQEGYMRLFYDNVAKIQFRAGGDSFIAGGKLGIGLTTTPLNTLHVAGSVRATSGVYFNSTSTQGFKIENDTGNNELDLYGGALVPAITLTNSGYIKFGNYGLSGASGVPVKLLGLDSNQNVVAANTFSATIDDQLPTADGDASGTIVNWTVSTSTTAGSLYVVISSGGWQTTDADFELRSIGMLGIALSTDADEGMLLQGFFYKAAHGFTIGLPLYISNTSGAFTTTRPTGTNDYVRIIGYATSANYIYFDPDKTWIKLT